jgi:hypothetical protein
MLIDAAIPGDRDMNKKEAEKIFRCKDLIIEIHCVSNVRAKVIPVITGATGTISATRATYRESTKLRNYKKTKAMLGTALIPRKVLM